MGWQTGREGDTHLDIFKQLGCLVGPLNGSDERALMPKLVGKQCPFYFSVCGLHVSCCDLLLMCLFVPLIRSKRHTIKLSSFRAEKTIVFHTVFSGDGGLIVAGVVEA